MSNNEIGHAILVLSVLLGSVHFAGYLFEKFHQPRLVGEILAGIILGPFVLGKIYPDIFVFLFGTSTSINKTGIVLNFIYWLGLLLLMFISGSQARRVLAEENRRETAWILGIGTPIPFFLVLILGFFDFLSIEAIMGRAGDRTSALLILSIAVAVTSIPVISRIFYDLKILHTRFASLILGSAVLEDIILWTVLSITTALAGSATLAGQRIVGNITSHIGATVTYIAIGFFVTPYVLKRFHVSRWNVFVKSSAIGYIVLVLFVYAAIAALLEVTLVFAAFLAGFGVVGGMNGSERKQFSKALESIEHFSISVFVPIYFLIVGHKLVFGADFSLWMLIAFLSGSSFLALVSVGLASKLAGFKGLDILNIAITTNARGGPGIVLGSVAYDAGIINASFYTTLILTAVITSQFAGVWLRFVLTKGWPLLSSNPDETWTLAKSKLENSDQIEHQKC